MGAELGADGGGGTAVVLGGPAVDVGVADSPIVTSAGVRGGSTRPVSVKTTTTAANRAAAVTSRATVWRDAITRSSLATQLVAQMKPS